MKNTNLEQINFNDIPENLEFSLEFAGLRKVDTHPRYWVSDCGQVIDFKREKVIRPVDCNGYHYVHLSDENGNRSNKYVHRLVGFAHIPNDDPINKNQINHKSGVKIENHVYNLEWCSNYQNCKHASNELDNGIPGFKLSETDVRKIHTLWLTGESSNEEIAVKFDVATSVIHYIVNGKIYIHIYAEFSDQYQTFNKPRKQGNRLAKHEVYECLFLTKKSDLSDAQLAVRYGVGNTTINRIRNGRHPHLQSAH